MTGSDRNGRTWERQQGDSDRVSQQGEAKRQGEGKAAGRGQASAEHVLVLPSGKGQDMGSLLDRSGQFQLDAVGAPETEDGDAKGGKVAHFPGVQAAFF